MHKSCLLFFSEPEELGEFPSMFIGTETSNGITLDYLAFTSCCFSPEEDLSSLVVGDICWRINSENILFSSQNHVNPAMDFTQTPPGMLALDNMLYFAKHHQDAYIRVSVLVLLRYCQCPMVFKPTHRRRLLLDESPSGFFLPLVN